MRVSASVRPKKAKRTPNVSSSQAAGPDVGQQLLEVLLALGGELVDDLRPTAAPLVAGSVDSAIKPWRTRSFRQG